MKIYEYYLNTTKQVIIISTFEVEETPKMYIGKYVRVRKSQLNKLDQFSDAMYTLTNDALELFEKLLLERYNDKIKYFENQINKINLKKEALNVAVLKED